MSVNRIVFFGTPEFATHTLKALLDEGFDIPAVVTVPDMPAGRGLKLKESDVKRFANSMSIPVLQPVQLNDTAFINQLEALKPDLQVVVAFKKLPVSVFNLPPVGTINLHASLLPNYRGAAPINHAIINGETETGVTTFFLNDKIDAGHILLQKRVPILENDNAGSLHDKLKTEGAELVIETLRALNNNLIIPVPQDKNIVGLRSAPKLFKTDCLINWSDTCENIYNKIRGLSPYPGAYTDIISPEGVTYSLKVYESSFERTNISLSAGSLLTDGKTYLKVVAADGLVTLQHIQLTGKVSMSADTFLRGFRLNNNFRAMAT